MIVFLTSHWDTLKQRLNTASQTAFGQYKKKKKKSIPVGHFRCTKMVIKVFSLAFLLEEITLVMVSVALSQSSSSMNHIACYVSHQRTKLFKSLMCKYPRAHHHHLSLNRKGRYGTPFFPVLHCPLGLGELQACPFLEVVFPPLPLSAWSSSHFHCALQDGFGQT